MAAAMQCSKCTAERKGFRRELDSWRHTLIHCVGFESILTGIYGPMLLKDLNLFVDCEPDEVDDWSAQASLSQCLFCNLPLDKLNDQVPAAASPASSPSDYSPCQTSTISESSQSAHRFLQAVFQKKDVTLDCDPKIPLLAQELMKKMIRQFAEEYMSKCQLSTPTNGVTRPSSPSSQTSDGPLDLTVNRRSEERESEPETGGVLDLSKRNPTSSATSSSNHDALGSWLPSVAEEGRIAGQRGNTSHRRSALEAVLRFLCPAHQSLIYKIFKLALQERLLPPHNHRPCTVPNRERSPSPPRLSPIPQHIGKKVDEKPPWLYHHAQEKEADLMVKNSQRSPRRRTAGLDGAAELQRRTVGHERAEQNAEETLLQDVVRRFNRKLDAITSGDKDPAIVSAAVSEEQSQRPSTSEPFPIDVPQTETGTALHTGGASDDLSEQLHRRQDEEPKSPNTRSRRQQEAQVAVPTPADAARPRKNTSAVKRKFAVLDPSCGRRNGTKAKKGRLKEENTSVPTSSMSSEPDLLKEASERKTDARAELVKNHGVNEKTPSTVSAQNDSGKEEETKAAMGTDELPTVKEEREGETGVDKRDPPISAIRHAPELQSTRGKQAPKADYVPTPAASMTPTCATQIPRLCTEGCGWRHEEATSVQHLDSGSFPVSEGQKCKSHQSAGVRKSMRNINPPQWISDYVISPPVFHGSSVETDGTRAKVDSRSPLDPQEHKGNLTFEPTPKEAGTQVKGKCQGSQKTVAIEKKSSPVNSPEKETGGNDCPAYRTRQSSTRTPPALKSLQNTLDGCSPTSPKSQYVSPIRIMFVSPVKDNEGVKYSLKSATSGFSLETEEPFDPCVESSWSGTPQKHKSESKERPVSPTKKSPSPAKASSISSPAKSPKCQASPRSAASSPKPRSRTSGDSTPSKRLFETENQRSSRESASLCETTPPKRRPGRPRKLGPQLEQKAKRPIGRPRKQKQADAVTESKSANGKSSRTDADDDVTKNLKITVVYGRSRRNKRVVSESFDQLQTHFKNACNAVCLKSDLGLSLHCSRRSSGIRKLPPEEVSPAKEPPPQSSSSIKSQGQNDSAPSRKPGRPAKIKISGISVTVTAASPRRRQIQINRETRVSPKTQPPKKAPLTESAEEDSCAGSSQRPTETSQTEVMETRNRNKCEPPNQTVALRHPQRERKPSIHLLHAVATSPSRWYKCSHALVRRSRQLLMNKASNEKRQEEQQTSAESQAVKRQPCRKERQRVTQELNKVAKISLDSIFSPRKTVRWWAASAKEHTMNQELARRIRAISETWVAADEQNKLVQTSALDTAGDSPVTSKSKISSAVRALFDCSTNEPRSCSMQQISYWFMQTTETQSLAIVKKASSRNPYELMHFPRSTSKENVRHSPQAERLHKHIKKFPRAVPISPLQHRQAQLRLRKKKRARRIRGRLFVSSLAAGVHTRGLMRWRSSLSAQFRATLFRVRRRFLTLRERERWQRWKGKKQRRRKTPRSNGPVASALQPDGSAKRPLPDSLRNGSVDQTLKLSSKAWSPEKLKECRVFLRKINSPDSESAEEEGDSCTVTLDNGSPSTDLFEGEEKGLGGAAKAVRNGRKRSSNKRTCSTNLSDPAPRSPPKGKQRAKHKQAEVAPPSEEPPPGKVLRQSRMRGLTGLRWCDFVFET
uniref:Ligand dependent nuclear receptor corepressor-like n=1 Tax=Fundulus heteroclitus TaxID=8078 RepID=A0A146SJP2_FUNHE